MTKKNAERGAISPLAWLVLIIAGLWVLWYFSGGPQQTSTQTGPFIQPPAPLGNGQSYGMMAQ